MYFLTRASISRLFTFILGLAFGHIIAFLFFPSEFAIDYPWKFGLAVPFGMLTVLFSSMTFRNNRVISAFILVLFGICSILLAGRSIGGVFILSGILTWYLSGSYIRRNNILWDNVYIFIILIGVTAGAVYQGYSYVAENGYLGEVSRLKYLHQSSSQYGLLLSGRVEVFASTQAISDSPIFGHGSWARDWKYIDLLQKIREYDSENTTSYIPEDNLIPSHSHILGAWVESGVLGALFWFYILWSIFHCFKNIKSKKTEYLPIIIWALIMLVWDLFFSPMGAYQRVLSGFYILVVLYARNDGFYKKASNK